MFGLVVFSAVAFEGIHERLFVMWERAGLKLDEATHPWLDVCGSSVTLPCYLKFSYTLDCLPKTLRC